MTWSPILLAAVEGDFEKIQELADEDEDNIHATNEVGETCLHLLAEHNYVEISFYLICKGADINKQNCRGTTPLHIASWYGYDSFVDLLLKSEANVHLEDDDGETALHRAASEKHVGICKVLTEHGADPNKENNEGVSAKDLIDNLEGSIEKLQI